MMITKPIIKNNVWIDKLYYIFFPSVFKFLLRAVKLSLFLFCFSASINIQSNSKMLIEPFSVAFSEELTIEKAKMVILRHTIEFSEELTIEKAKIAKAVWKIKGNRWNGTGFFISENKIVTNAHVVGNVKDLEEITIVQEGNPRRLKANKIVNLSIRDDLALLEVDGVVSDFIILSEDPLNSSNVYALGYPNGRFQEIRQMSVLQDDYFVSNNLDIKGASGSPLLNEAHQLVGVLYQAFHNHINFINLETLNSFIKDEYFLCEDNVQECFKSLRESFETNPQEVKNGKDSFNIYQYLRLKGDLPRAKWWLKKATEQGYAMVQYRSAVVLYRLAVMYYYKEEGRAQDIQLARFLFEQAAEKGYALAQYNLAVMYSMGEGGAQDIQRAKFWFEQAAQQGYALAQYHLALMYYKGEGGAQDIQRAREWFEKAAQQGYALAQYNLALMYYKGEGGAQDIQRAREWFEKAAEQGYALAQYNLALMYDKGEGGAQDIQRAREWFEKAAEQDHASAQYNLALMYYNGKGVEQNTQRAIELFEKAAEQGDASAQFFLVGIYYIRKKGIEPDIPRARYWFEKEANKVMLQLKKILD